MHACSSLFSRSEARRIIASRASSRSNSFSKSISTGERAGSERGGRAFQNFTQCVQLDHLVLVELCQRKRAVGGVQQVFGEQPGNASRTGVRPHFQPVRQRASRIGSRLVTADSSASLSCT